MTDPHHRFVNDTYGPRARDYLDSAVHARGEDLDALEALVRGRETLRVLDLGCGGGHVSFRLSPHVAEVAAVDVSQAMLDVVLRAAAERGLCNVTAYRSPVERLPFPDRRFDFVATRFSAHHWHDLEAGLREARRVLANDGRAVFVDTVSPSSVLLDSHLQTIELLRDAAHVRNYTAAEWVAGLARARFEVVSLVTRRLRLEFDTWIARTRTPPLHAQAIRSFQSAAPEEVRRRFGIEPDGTFQLDALQLEVRPV